MTVVFGVSQVSQGVARPIRGEVFLFTVKQIARLLKGVHGLRTPLLLVHIDLYYSIGVVVNLS